MCTLPELCPSTLLIPSPIIMPVSGLYWAQSVLTTCAGAHSSKVHLPTVNFSVSVLIFCKVYWTISNYVDSVYQLSPDIINNRVCCCCCCCCRWSSNLLSWMRDSAPSVCERAHGRGDKIITMVTTGCGPSRGMEGESHTDANSPRGTNTHIPHRNKYSHTHTQTQKTFTHIFTNA